MHRYSLLSPSGAAAVFVSEHLDVAKEGPEPKYNILPVGKAATPQQWLTPHEDADLPCMQLPQFKAWSPSGRYLACFLSAKLQATAGSDTVIRVWDSERVCWLPELSCAAAAPLLRRWTCMARSGGLPVRPALLLLAGWSLSARNARCA